MSLEEITLGEVYRDQKEFQREVTEGLSRIERRMDNFVTHEIHQLSLRDHESRISVLEDGKTWLYRSAAGAVIAGLAGLFFAIVRF